MVNGDLVLSNIPCYAMEVSFGDTVEADIEHDMLVFRGVKERGGHNTVRIVPFGDTDGGQIIEDLKRMGCWVETVNNLIAVNIPPSAEVDNVRSDLAKEFENGALYYQESDVHWA